LLRRRHTEIDLDQPFVCDELVVPHDIQEKLERWAAALKINDEIPLCFICNTVSMDGLEGQVGSKVFWYHHKDGTDVTSMLTDFEGALMSCGSPPVFCVSPQ